ncbi:Hypothetical protein A7982_01285 [Minicystis rosea]|nr:Hypothetical protein A7982_01285 [Minicystis rosea]
MQKMPVEILAVPGRPRAGAARSLAPREHGAYGQLATPLVAALAMGRPNAPAILLAVAAVGAFLVHEPVLVALGQRGTRAKREDGARAWRRITVTGAVTALAGGVGLWLAPAAARAAAAAPIALALALSPFMARGAEKTAAGELLAAAALASASVPVAVAAGVSPAAAWSGWAAWCLVFGASTLAVRGVIAHARTPLPWTRRAAAPALATVVALVLMIAGVLSPITLIGVAPMLVIVLAIAVRPPSPRSLKRVGWALVGGSVALTAALAIGGHL